jgi:hypothetical protein
VGLVSLKSINSLDMSNTVHIVVISNNASNAKSQGMWIDIVYHSWQDNEGRLVRQDIVQTQAQVRIDHGQGVAMMTTTMMMI